MSIKFCHTSKFNVEELEKRDLKIGEIIKAEPFVLVHNGMYLEFNLVLGPNGVLVLDPNVINDIGTHVQGIFVGLRSLNQERKLGVPYKVSIFLSNGSYHPVGGWYKGGFEGIHLPTCLSTCPKPVAGNLTELKSKSLLVDNETNLCVTIELKIAQSYFDFGDLVKSNISSLDYKNIGFCSDLYAKRGGVHNSTDYEIACRGSNERFRIHKVVAWERSPYFENLITSHSNYGQEKCHTVGWSPGVAKEIIHFIYNDNTMVPSLSIPSEELVDVANMLELKKLVAICEKRYITHINKDNAWELLRIADTYEMKYLKKKALCVVTEDPKLAQKLVDDGKKKKLREEVAEFLMKRGRAQMIQ